MKKEIIEQRVKDLVLEVDTFRLAHEDNISEEIKEGLGAISEQICNLLNGEEILISNHELVRFRLAEAIKVAREDGDVAEFEYMGLGITYEGVTLEPAGEDDSILFLYRIDSNGDNMEVARIILKGNIEYDITGNGYYSNLVEIK